FTTICGKTTVDASGMIGSSAGMSHVSISTCARAAAAVIFSIAPLSSVRSPPLSEGPFLFPDELIVPRGLRPAAAPRAGSGLAAAGEEAVGENLVDQLGRQEIRCD